MTSPPDVLALARHHGEEFLDETAKLAGSAPKQQVWDALKRSRAVVMELVTALTPRPTSVPVSESRPVTFSDDLKAVRSEIYSATSQEPGWHVGMLGAIATAQRMGAEHFELVVKTEQKTGEGPRPRPFGWSPMMAWDPDDQWRYSQAGTFPVSTIKVYAVGIR